MQERNFMQLEKDMVNRFYEITRDEVIFSFRYLSKLLESQPIGWCFEEVLLIDRFKV